MRARSRSEDKQHFSHPVPEERQNRNHPFFMCINIQYGKQLEVDFRSTNILSIAQLRMIIRYVNTTRKSNVVIRQQSAVRGHKFRKSKFFSSVEVQYFVVSLQTLR